jgi:hypothetical protein
MLTGGGSAEDPVRPSALPQLTEVELEDGELVPCLMHKI